MDNNGGEPERKEPCVLEQQSPRPECRRQRQRHQPSQQGQREQGSGQLGRPRQEPASQEHRRALEREQLVWGLQKTLLLEQEWPLQQLVWGLQKILLLGQERPL